MPGMKPAGEGSGDRSAATREAMAAGDIDVADMGMMTPAAWTAGYVVLMFFMWWAMMVAMMLPSAAPMILLFATVNRKQRARADPFVPTSVFAGAYLVTWGGFSLVAVGLQWTLQRLTWLSPMAVSTSSILGGLLLLAAGLYQLTPIKQACLRHCRHPITFLASHWRRGTAGAVRMGLEHGAYCVGCCWFLMGLLFVGGVMNLVLDRRARPARAVGKDGPGRTLARLRHRGSARRLGPRRLGAWRLVYCAGNSWQSDRADAEVRMPYRRPTALVLSEAERGELEGWARRRRTAQALALRARIVLRSADGLSNTAIAHELGIAKHTVGKWRERFARLRGDGLLDEPRPGRAAPDR